MAAATVDHLSGGRFVFGIGYGYIDAEFRNHAVDPRQRRDVLRDKTLAMEAIWSEPVTSYSGRFVQFRDCEQYPKPVQRPRPPVLVGGKLRDQTIDHIVEFADGWIPTAMMASSLGSDIARLRDRAAAAGRDPESIQVTVFHMSEGRRRNTETWEPEPVFEETVAQYEAAGVTTLCLALPSTGADVTEVMDQYVATIGHRLAAAGDRR
jgi:alkanesulfonate monooxygenase SsuD/methylene tetrahydromethanopterin reductase-like flavin-dependent oxidoreductase (luciferase family)